MLAERADGAEMATETDAYPRAGEVILFDVRTPNSVPETRANVAHALTLGLPRAHTLSLESPTPIAMVANGPSATTAPFTPDGTLALNGAMGLFTDRGVAPQFWAACDSQEMVAGFLPLEPPTETVYLVASKCHPAVFERLRGRNVYLWHVDDPDHNDLHGEPTVMCAVSITLCAMTLMRLMGHTAGFVTYGWDGCYTRQRRKHPLRHRPVSGPYADNRAYLAARRAQRRGDRAIKRKAGWVKRDHAVGQAHNDALNVGVRVPTVDGDRVFQTTGPWAAEAQDAVVQLSMADYPVEVRGGGMIGAILRATGALVREEPHP